MAGKSVKKIYSSTTALVLILSIIISLVATWFYIFKPLVIKIPAEQKQLSPTGEFQSTTSANQQDQLTGTGGIAGNITTPSFSLVLKDKETLIISWQNLHAQTVKLAILRALKNTNLWELWKIIAIEATKIKNGSTTINLDKKDDVLKFSYYIQSLSKDDKTLWASPLIQIQLPLSQSNQTSRASSQPPTAPTAAQPAASAGTTSETSSITPTPAQSTNNSSSPPPSNLNSNNTTDGAYYSPEGKVSGSLPPPLGSFWVRYINNTIEIGWQSLPPPTDMLIIYRSTSQTGPWVELLRQRQPDTIGPKFIRLIDFAVGVPYYYKMEAFSQSQLIATYAPIFLPALAQ